jgi:ubiquinone/menaquinone biosynthesis C-methylase UbiE
LRRQWGRLAFCIGRLLATQPARTTHESITRSYDGLADDYDQAWTDHMRAESLAMLNAMTLPAAGQCLDLACGTGFVTAELVRRTGGEVTGVDASAGMLDVARRCRGEQAAFVQADALEFLRAQRPASFDAVTCAWGMGYSRPAALLRQIARVLRPGGAWGIIDNTTFSLAGVMLASLRTFAERPDALARAMNVRFLPHSLALAALARAAGLGVARRWDGHRRYSCPSGQAALARLTASGAAAGFEFAAEPVDRDVVFDRFATLLEGPDGQAAITHRYLAGVGRIS